MTVYEASSSAVLLVGPLQRFPGPGRKTLASRERARGPVLVPAGGGPLA